MITGRDDNTLSRVASLINLLVLGRVSNLPTVWSNCLAGWWLGGGGNAKTLPFLFAGVTCLYAGGMFLNDAFDVEFDRQHREERPVPSGALALATVWRWGFALLVVGVVLLFCANPMAGALGVMLALGIVLYDAIHKAITFSPVLMGICRCFVYLIAASTARSGVTGWAIWCGLALGFYVIGLSFIARRESAHWPVPRWPATLLGAPVVLAQLMNAGDFRLPALLLSLVLVLWLVRCLRRTFWTNAPNVPLTVSGLLAGIVLVDWLAIADAPHKLGFAFLALFAAALLFQRFAPAT